eukprot:RCo037593
MRGAREVHRASVTPVKSPREFQYVSREVDADLICSICLSPWVEPVQTPCEHVFCKACIAAALGMTQNCPQCRMLVSLPQCTPAMRLLRAKVDALHVFCYHRCGWKGARSELAAHMTTHNCRFSAQGCTWNGPALDIHLRAEHSCSFQEAGCQWLGLRSDLPGHILCVHSCRHRRFGCDVVDSEPAILQHQQTCRFKPSLDSLVSLVLTLQDDLNKVREVELVDAKLRLSECEARIAKQESTIADQRSHIRALQTLVSNMAEEMETMCQPDDFQVCSLPGDLEWDPPNTSGMVEFGESRLSLRVGDPVNAISARSVCSFSRGCYYIEVEVQSLSGSGGYFLGVASSSVRPLPPGADLTKAPLPGTWLLEDSCHVHIDGQCRKVSDKVHFKKKSRVGMLLNMNAGKLTFYIDRKKFEAFVFGGLPREPLHLFAALRSKGTKVVIHPEARAPI